jgi:hypothetical protein
LQTLRFIFEFKLALDAIERQWVYFSDKPLCKRYDLSLNLSWHSMQSSASGYELFSVKDKNSCETQT